MELSEETGEGRNLSTKVADAKKRFRWRVIPVTILYVMGAPSLVGTVVVFGMRLWWRFSRPDAVDVGVGPNSPMLVGSFFAVIAAALWLLTALRLQQGRWWSAGAAASVATLLYFIFVRLGAFE